MYSIGNSYDYNNQSQSLPFEGTFENLSDYNFIYIYTKTIRNDTLTIEYTNDITTGYEIEESYNINNTEKEITLTKKLKYFRIKITSTDQFSSSDQRLYSVYFFNASLIVNSRLQDGSGNNLTSTSNNLNVNVTNDELVNIALDTSTIKNQVNKLTFDASNNLYVNNYNRVENLNITNISSINANSIGLIGEGTVPSWARTVKFCYTFPQNVVVYPRVAISIEGTRFGTIVHPTANNTGNDLGGGVSMIYDNIQGASKIRFYIYNSSTTTGTGVGTLDYQFTN